MEPTCRIETNVLTRRVRGARPMGKKWIKEALEGTNRRRVTAKALKKLRKKGK